MLTSVIQPTLSKSQLTIWMTDYTSDLSIATGSNLAIQSLNQIDTATEELPSPALVTDTMRPENLTCEWRESICSITDEASYSMCVHSQHERNEEMMGVPEGLEGLLTNAVVGSRVHQEHA